MNIIDREEFLQRLDLRIRAMSALMVTHEKYILSLSVSGEKREKHCHTIEKANKEWLDAVSKIDNEIRENFNKLRQEDNVSEGEEDG